MPEGQDLNAERRSGVVTPRAVILGLVIMILFAFVTPYNDYYLNGTFITGNHFPLGAVFVFVLLVLAINPILRKLAPGTELATGELIVIWCMMIVASGIPSSGMCRYWFSMQVGPYYYATDENQWEALFLQHIPKWTVPSTDPDGKVIKYFFEGLPEGMKVPWGAWRVPMLFWGVFVGLLYWSMFCLCVILRKQWVEQEKLSFPLTVIPLEMARAPEEGRLVNSFMRDKLLWIGFGIPVMIHGLNGLHSYFNWVPTIPMTIPVQQLFHEPPWNAVSRIALRFYPSVIAFCYLLTLEVSFSFWFFFLFLQAEFVVGSMIGRTWNAGGYWGKFAIHQQAGAFIVFAVLLLWRSRRHLTDVWRKAWHNDPNVDDSTECFSYRTAVFGLIGAVVGITVWSTVLGMSPVMSFVATLLLLMILIVLCRLVAQGGLLFIYQNFCPYDIMTAALGPGAVGTSTVALLAIQNIIFIHDARETMIPSVMNSMKITDGAKVRRKPLFGAMVLSIVITILFAGYATMMLAYKYGGLNLPGNWFGMRTVFGFKMGPVANMLRRPEGTIWTNVGYMAWGAGLMAFLFTMGGRYYWWPLHPLGLLMANSFAIEHFWFSIMLGWMIKSCILKYGGGGTYKRLRGFFLGTVLGDLCIGAFWIIVGLIAGKTGAAVRILPE